MKKLLSLAICLLLVTFAFANDPTVTTTQLTKDAYNIYYEISWGFHPDRADSAFVLDPDDEPFSIGFMGGEENNGNQTVTLSFQTTETATDSTGYTVLWQCSEENNPNAGRGVTADQYTTWETDALSSAVSYLASFTPAEYGRPRWLRVIVYPTTVADIGIQTITARLTIPRTKKDRDLSNAN